MNPLSLLLFVVASGCLGGLGLLLIMPKLSAPTMRVLRLGLGVVVVGALGLGMLTLSLPSMLSPGAATYYDAVDEEAANGPPEIVVTQVAEADVRTISQALTTPAPQTQRLIIRNGSARLVVTDTRAARAAIEAVVARLAGEGAFVVSAGERSSSGDSPIINMQIRVPATQFDNVMAQLTALAVQVENRNETAQDVTAEYVDLAARVASLEAARDRLREIMEKAATTEDLLQAEAQLADREAEIEGLKGQMQYLAQSAQLSSITLELWPDVVAQPLDNTWRPAETARRAFDGLVESLKDFVDFLIVFGIAGLPWLLFWGLVAWGGWRVFQRLRARRTPPPAPPAPPAG